MVGIWKDNLKASLTHFSKWIKQTSYYPLLYKDLNQSLTDVDEPIQLLITGGFGSGKTTFINAFIGEELLSSSSIPETAMVTKLVYGRERELAVTFNDGRSDIFPLEWLESLSTDREGPGTAIKPYISAIEIKLPIDLLKLINIIDTPGLDANSEHDKITEKAFQQADAAVWLFYMESAGKVKEYEYIKQLKEYRVPVYGVINQVDGLVEAVDDEEEEQTLEELEDNSKRVQVNTDYAFEEKPIGITAYHALQAKKENDDEELTLTNWSSVDDMFQIISVNNLLKQDRIYHALQRYLLRLFPELEKVRDSLPFQEYRLFSCAFDVNYFRENLKDYRETIKAIHKVYETWEEFQNEDRQDTDELEELDVLLWKLNTVAPQALTTQNFQFYEMRNELKKLSNKINQHYEFLNEYQDKKNDVEAWAERLEHQWSSLKYKTFWGMGELRAFEEDQINQRVSYNKLEKFYKDLARDQQRISKEVVDFNQKFQSLMSEFLSSLDKYEEKQIEKANQYIGDKQQEYRDLTEESLSKIHTFTKDVSQLVQGLGPAFEEKNESESFQETYQVFKRISHLNGTYDFTKKNLKDFKELHNTKPLVKRANRIVIPFLDETVVESAQLYPPRKPTAHPVYSLIEKLSKKRKRAFKLSLIAMVIFFIVQTGTIGKMMASEPEEKNMESKTIAVNETSYEEERDDRELEEESNHREEEFVAPSEMESDPEPEVEDVPVHLPYDQVERFFEEYRTQYFRALNRKDFSIVRPYLVENSQAYSVLENYISRELPEVYEFRDQHVDVLSVSEVLEDDVIHVETYETFTYEDEKGDQYYYAKEKEYTLNYRDYDDSLSIKYLDTVSDEVEVERFNTLEMVSRQDIYDYMYDHQVEKFRAMNSNSVELASSFYEGDSAAEEELMQEIEAFDDQSKQIGLQEYTVSGIEEDDATHYIVDIEVKQVIDHEEENVRIIQNLFHQYRVSVNRDGFMRITDHTLEQLKDERVESTEISSNEDSVETNQQSTEEDLGGEG
ncbi:dynamin family protein [Halobacillus litoralis]|uniref:TcaA NTF2-like domain-containing protein n=1 Tax=Halobacillus litoralis TaxID=45668 RepID=UPI001CFEC4EA|nr:dynamin family protein [Halobacillus litoralis]